MGRRSKKSKKSKRRQVQPDSKKQYSSLESVIYYALAAVGVLVLISLVIGLLGYLKIF